MEQRFMREVIEMAVENARSGRGGPFAALVVRDGQVLARGTNRVTSTNDPTAHAEMVAIRAACEQIASHQLEECDVYTSCEPCPMCMGALYWARPRRILYASTREDAARAGFDDAYIYDELAAAPGDRTIPMENVLRDEARAAFDAWQAYEKRVDY